MMDKYYKAYQDDLKARWKESLSMSDRAWITAPQIFDGKENRHDRRAQRIARMIARVAEIRRQARQNYEW